jgi:hypothetical protein
MTTISVTVHEDLVSTFVLLAAVRNVVWLDNSANGITYPYVSMATINGFMELAATCRSTTIQRVIIFVIA